MPTSEGSVEELQARIAHLNQLNAATADALRSVESTLQPGGPPTPDPVEASRSLAARMRDVLPLSELAILLLNEEDMEFRQVLSIPAYSAETLAKVFEEQLQKGTVGWTVSEKRLTILPREEVAEGAAECRALMLMPIATPRRVWGIAIGLSPQPLEDISESVWRLLRIVANQGAMAIENAQLYRSLSDQNHDLERAVAARTTALRGKNEELEKAYEELRRQDRMKDEFLSLVAHELRTPLTAILSFSEFLQEEGLTAEETAEFSGHIRQEGLRLQRLVNDVLDLSRMEAGKLSFEYNDYDLNDLIRMCVASQKGTAGEKNIEIRIEFDDQPLTLRFDRDRLQQVILNLLSNAIKYNNDGGWISVRTHLEDDVAVIVIEDNGIGIAARDIPKVFNKFERIEDLRYHTKGTGLGMSITKHIVAKGHGGSVWVESPGRGQGSTFTVRLPLPRGQAAPEPQGAAAEEG